MAAISTAVGGATTVVTAATTVAAESGKGAAMTGQTALPRQDGRPSVDVRPSSTVEPVMEARVLVADDEQHIVDVVRAYLERDGYRVETASDGAAALEVARRVSPDLLVLDVMMPRQSGFDVLRALRAEGSTSAVIMLTARDHVIDRVAGLELGADDYVTKPFEPRELVARVGAVLRRLTANGATVPDQRPNELRLADLVIDRPGREVRRRGASLELTRTEFDLLATLAERPHQVWTREQLGEVVFGEAFEAYDRTIDSHVKNVRRKLDPPPDGTSYVETLRGVGYRAWREAVRP
jgi:DNA-binding response OmpR family regulator